MCLARQSSDTKMHAELYIHMPIYIATHTHHVGMIVRPKIGIELFRSSKGGLGRLGMHCTLGKY